MAKPLVALVGRPNVGKSTLFNRLVGERLAVVDAVPGTTRDRLVAEAEWAGVLFDVVDTGGIDPGFLGHGEGSRPLSIGSEAYVAQIQAQAEFAIDEADAVLFVTDVQSGVTPADHEVAQILRRRQRERREALHPPVFLVVNKVDSESRRHALWDFYELGMGEPHPISALHGLGVGDLLDQVLAAFQPQPEDEDDDSVRIAIVGQPNVGKSSLLNRLLGQERTIVSPIPGTTRDAVDTFIEFAGVPITLIDTAGIRRRGRVEPGVEKYSVIRSLRAIERSDVALLVVDATRGLIAQDAHIAGFILDAWKSAVVLVNKWDAVPKEPRAMDRFSLQVRQRLDFMDYVPVLFISAKTGERVDQVLPLALRVQEERLVRLPTSRLNQILRRAQDVHAAPSRAGRRLKIYYGTQVRGDPPTFLLYVNNPELVHFTYKRFLENQIRQEAPFLGTPIRLVFRERPRSRARRQPG